MYSSTAAQQHSLFLNLSLNLNLPLRADRSTATPANCSTFMYRSTDFALIGEIDFLICSTIITHEVIIDF